MSRARQSNAPTATPASRAVELPDHEFPSYPLNPAAVHALQKLQSAQCFSTLQRHLDSAGELINDNVNSVNECLQARESYTRRLGAKLRKNGDDPTGEEEKRVTELEQRLEQMRTRVERMTQKMDESIRKIIDGEHAVTAAQDTLSNVYGAQQQEANSAAFSQRGLSTQGRSTQRQVTQDTDMPDFEPTDPGADTAATQSAVPKTSAAVDFGGRQESTRDAYQAHSLYERYADNNRYVGFKRTVHDALNPGEDAPPLPHKSTWFRSGNSPAPGVTADEDDNGEEEDDDIAVARERISTKCPLTLLEFEDVVTSKKCPHSFERTAIMGMMRSTDTQGRRGGPAGLSVQCPVPGCGQHLTPRDLWVDPVLVRKIRRIQNSRAALRGEDILATSSPAREGGASGRVRAGPASDSDGSDSGEDIDAVERRTQRRSTVPRQSAGRAGMARVQSSSTATDHGGTDEDEEDDEEDEEF